MSSIATRKLCTPEELLSMPDGVVPLCLLCSAAGVLFTHNDVNIFVQIGLVVLVGLACRWLVQVQAGNYGLVLPLGGEAQVRLTLPSAWKPNLPLQVILYDVSGANWSALVMAAAP